ncbi:MAG TPA: hypothetical protein VMR86_17710 [Myxococcota bacterium]|nr:hypothetical protein [Myxococcota bacterium]
MKSLAFGLVSVMALGLALSGSAHGASDDVVWNATTDYYDVRLELAAGAGSGSITIASHPGGAPWVGLLDPGLVLNSDPSVGPDSLVDDGIFLHASGGAFDSAGLVLVDLDGVAFDGAVPFGSGPYSLMPKVPPPLELFETAILAISLTDQNGSLISRSTYPILTLTPEPTATLLSLMVLPLVVSRLSRRWPATTGRPGAPAARG